MGLLKWIDDLKKRKKIQKSYQTTYDSGPVPEQSSPSSNVGTYISWTNSGSSSPDMKYSPVDDKRIIAKPKDVVTELMSETEINIDFNNLNQKLKVVKQRRDFMKIDMQLPAIDEEMAICYLEAAIRYTKVKKGFAWQVTTKKKIDDLCSKYKVRIASLSGYHRCVPQEAIDEMKKYLDIFKRVTNGQEPKIQLIIDDQGPETVKDPIIIAGSPFGNWYYVLGAWDKEIEIMDKLFLR